jgi:hypothetical protein
MSTVFKYAQTNKAMPDSSYPYVGKNGTCKYDASQGLMNTVGYAFVKSKDPAALMAAVAV